MKYIKILIISICFFLAGTLHAHVDLVYPQGGEMFTQGDQVTIEWNILVAHNTINWDLYYSLDGGQNWDVIEEDIPYEYLTFDWTVPDVSTEEARIMIVQDNPGTDYSDQSNNFTIAPQPIQSGWQAQASGVDNFLLDVYFVDQDHGWIAGNTGIILHTNDGGLNWVEQDAPPSNNYGNIFFSDRNHGWATGPSQRLIHTSDGGETWTEQDAGVNTGLAEIFFLDENKGWIVGGDNGHFPSYIYHRLIIETSDGGSTWSTQIYESYEDPLSSVCFTNNQNGWAVGSNGVALHTVNGGNTWDQVLSEESYDFHDVFFINESKGWILATYLGLPHAEVVYRTVDGGQTWTSQEFSPELSLVDLYFTDQDNGWIVGGELNQSLMMRTSDGGETWNVVIAPVEQYFSAVDFADDAGWAVGYDGTVITSLPQIPAEQTITLSQGWSGISSYVKPEETSVSELFFPFLIDMNILQNFEGVYWPAAGINTIGDWDHHAGYQIKMAEDHQIILSGILQNNYKINLQEGWNFLPVLNNKENNAADIFNQISDNLEIAKDVAGWDVYWPQYNVNTLDVLAPGKSYLVKVNAGVELEFPTSDINQELETKSTNKLSIKQTEGKKQGLDFNPTPVSHVIAIPAEGIDGLNSGDVIRLMNQQGMIMDEAAYAGKNIVLTAFADDPTTVTTDGMNNGEHFRFEVLQAASHEIFGVKPVFDHALPQADYFSTNGISAIKSFVVTGIQDYDSVRISLAIHPNPSDGIFNIETGNSEKVCNWKVLNINGAVMVAGSGSSKNLGIDLSGYSSGIYYLVFSRGSHQAIEKLVLK